MRLAPLRPIWIKLGMVLGGLRLQKVTRAKKGQVKFHVARIWLKFGEGDASAKCVLRRRPSEVKGQVKFQVARMELKLWENSAH